VTKGSLLEPLDAAVFGLKPGGLSDVVESDKGCHVIRLEKLLPARKLPLSEAAPGIVERLRTKRARKTIAAWLKRLRAESYVKIPGSPGGDAE
jgi:parvulin-like peptidyl-prolyl isomerase